MPKNEIDFNSRQAFNYLLKKDFHSFYNRTFLHLHQKRDFYYNWHIGAISEFLTGMRMGQFRRGNINISPRWGKTLQCSVAFPMWWLGDEPWMNIICASYSAELSAEIHGKCRAIANASWFKQAFPQFDIKSTSEDAIDTAETKNTQKQFTTSQGGSRIATSTGGSITGKGADLIIGDDVMNPAEAASKAKRETALEWCSSTLFSRFDDKKKGIFLNVQQRLQENDFTGTFVDNKWEQLIIPVRFEEKKFYKIGRISKQVEAGEWLDERRYGKEQMEEDKKNMGTRNFDAQYLQKTTPDDGDIFKKEYFRYYTYAPKFDYRCIYADTAQKEKSSSDYSVFMCFGIVKKNNRKFAYLIDILRKKMSSPKLVVAAKEFWEKHRTGNTIGLQHAEDWFPQMYSATNNGSLIKFAIEDKSSGQGLIQDLEEATSMPIIKLLAENDKVSRANDALPRFESGQVFFPKEAPFLSTLEKELLLFSPKSSKNRDVKKDQVDTISYAVRDLLFEPMNPKDRHLDYSFLENEIKKY
jgi:predicted phage terminase large subunit-like protein